MFKWIVKTKMAKCHIASLLELAQITGLGYQTMRTHIDHPERLKLFEVQALNEVLNFDDSELLTLIKGE